MAFKYKPVVAYQAQRVAEAIGDELPQTAHMLMNTAGEFRGLSCFLGETGGVVIGIKRYGDYAQPQVIWGSGVDFFDALASLEVRLQFDNWKPDKGEIKRTNWKETGISE